jgi:hypothetical protein
MNEPNKSRRALLVVGLKALALLAPVAAIVATPKPAEATWRGARRRYYRRRYY